ncbi:hypothetical protein E4U42_004946, partial [Claviceps africana]
MSSARRSSRRLRRLNEEASSQSQADLDGSMPVGEGSWRMVEGEHDSFDASILAASVDDEAGDALVPVSGGRTSAQGVMAASRDSIRDFVEHQDDEQVILRELFQPSVVSSASPGRQADYRTPDPQFRMPLMDMDGSRRLGSGSRAVGALGL